MRNFMTALNYRSTILTIIIVISTSTSCVYIVIQTSISTFLIQVVFVIGTVSVRLRKLRDLNLICNTNRESWFNNEQFITENVIGCYSISSLLSSDAGWCRLWSHFSRKLTKLMPKHPTTLHLIKQVKQFKINKTSKDRSWRKRYNISLGILLFSF